MPRLIPSPPSGSSRAIIQDQGGPKSPNSSAITWISDEVMSSTKILETSNELDEAGQDEDTVSKKISSKKKYNFNDCLLTKKLIFFFEWKRPERPRIAK